MGKKFKGFETVAKGGKGGYVKGAGCKGAVKATHLRL